ncbi:hypothetical protein RchiOBHm_Chr3g0488471 [Rosa chinensis]|uniref:Uncharacterized protein n=1 Tax=Rosa chinensis TaxID=74649 RepID=A0A2P6RFT0_ROSCH|nr:hypothetical protein RchiOBHm_Chr3g0488471 [Rosa chinensis]
MPVSGIENAREEYPTPVLGAAENSSNIPSPVEVVQTVARRISNSATEADKEACDHHPLEKNCDDSGGLKTLNIQFEMSFPIATWLEKIQKDAVLPPVAQFKLPQFSSSIKKLVLLTGALKPVIDLLSSPCLSLALAIGRLAQDTHNQADIAHNGRVVPLLKLLHSKNESLQHNAAFALYGLADKEDNIVALIKFGIVQKFEDGEFLVQQTKDCVEKTLKRLEGNICGRVSNNLLYLMRVTDEAVQSQVALAFAHLCKPGGCHVIFSEHKAMKLLLVLLDYKSLKSLKLQHDGSLALQKVATKATPLSLDVIAESLTVHCSMVVEASIILRYSSLLHSSLDCVDFRSAMLNFIHYCVCLVHAHEHALDYLFMTYTVHTLSLPVATMFIKDVTGGNLYLFEVAVLHFLCQTKASCHPRSFIVDEFFDFLKSNSKLSFVRYTCDVLLSSDNCVGFLTNMHKFFQHMVGHVHEDELFMATCSSTSCPPFHALVKKLFLLSPVVAIHLLRPLLADILRDDAQFIFGIMMVFSMNELMSLRSKKQGLEIGYSDIDNGNYCSFMSCSLHLPHFMITWFFDFTSVAMALEILH